MQVVGAQVVQGGEPSPLFRRGGRWTRFGDGLRRGFADEVVPVLVVVVAVVAVGDDLDLSPLCGLLSLLLIVGVVDVAAVIFFFVVEELFQGPSEATGVVGVDGLEDEQDGAGFEEEDRADKGRYATAVVDLAVELGRGSYHGKPDEEALPQKKILAICFQDRFFTRNPHSEPIQHFPT